MRKFFLAAIGSVVGLVGFAGAANASATVDLIWIDVSVTNAMGNVTCLGSTIRNCPPDPRSPDSGVTVSSVVVTDNITLAVVLTAGPLGSIGGGVSVNYGDALPKLGVIGFQSFTTTKPFVYLPNNLGTTTDQPPYINNINSAAAPTVNQGLGLPPGGTAYLGTVSFHKDALVNGTFEILVGTDGPGGTDGVLNGAGGNANPFLNSAFLVNVSGPITPTPTPTATPTSEVTPTPTPTATPTSEVTPTPTPTATPTSEVTPTPTPTATPTSEVTPTPTPTATPTVAPPMSCEATWGVSSITTIGKSNSPTNNLKVSHSITGNIIDPGAVCPGDGDCKAHRIPVCAGTGVTIAVTGSTDNSNIGKGVISCDASGCAVEAVDVTEKYQSVSSDGKDTDRMTLLPQ